MVHLTAVLLAKMNVRKTSYNISAQMWDVHSGVGTQVCDHTVSEAVWREKLCSYSGNTQLIMNTRSTFHFVTVLSWCRKSLRTKPSGTKALLVVYR